MSTRISAWTLAEQEQRGYFRVIAKARRPLLICDYDGTLAPFKTDKMQAYPYGGVAARLARLGESGTEICFVSGRPVSELLQLLPSANGSEVWGMHGREHQSARGKRTLLEPSPEQRSSLDAAQAALAGRGWNGSLVERKVGSLAMHWRTLAQAGGREEGRQQTQEKAQADAEQVFAAYAGHHAMGVLPFDGGLELRTEDRTKAHAVESLLASAEPGAAAFLGDDLTDEDGFRAIRAWGGLALLVRPAPRASAAHFFLRPPEELLQFLDAWVDARAAATAGSETRGTVL